MKKFLVLLICVLALIQVEVFGRGGFGGGSRGGGFHSSSSSRSGGSFRSSSRSSFGSSARSLSFRSGSKNTSKIGMGGSKGIRTFSKSSSPRSITRYVGKPFSRPRTIKTSRYSRRPVSFVYTRPVVFHNPYMTYYLLSNHGYRTHADSIRVDTNAFPGFGKGKSGGGGASARFVSDSLKKICSKSTLEITGLLPVNFASDFAGLYGDPVWRTINSLCRHYRTATGVEIAVVTVPTLGDEIDLEDYAEYLFDKWGIGQAGENNGVLIIISSEDEILRVQPGYGLEELLPDATCREIEDNILIPSCKNKQWGLATTNAVKEIIKRLGTKSVDAMKKDLVIKKKQHDKMMNNVYITLIIILLILFVAILWWQASNRRRW